jgi:hypothetical protein
MHLDTICGHLRHNLEDRPKQQFKAFLILKTLPYDELLPSKFSSNISKTNIKEHNNTLVETI